MPRCREGRRSAPGRWVTTPPSRFARHLPLQGRREQRGAMRASLPTERDRHFSVGTILGCPSVRCAEGFADEQCSSLRGGRTFSRRGGYQPPEKKQPGESPWLLRVHAAVSKLWINSALSKLWINSALSKLWINSAVFELRSSAVRFSSCAPQAAYCMPLMMELS